MDDQSTAEDAEGQAWYVHQLALSREYHARLAVITAAFATAQAHEGDCDVCAAILDIIPRDIPNFSMPSTGSGPWRVMSGSRLVASGRSLGRPTCGTSRSTARD